MSTMQDLVDTIEAHIAAAQEEIRSLEAARGALARDESNSAGARSETQPARRVQRQRQRASSTKTRRRTSVVKGQQLENLLTETDGLSTPKLASLAGADHKQVLDALRELEKAGRIKRSGERRGTRWHAISDEDRVAVRAAEIARQSRRRRSPATS